jgi:pyrroline-5-carboxylate reductase
LSKQRFDQVSFAGGGRVTHLLLEGWRRAGTLPSQVLVCDPDQAVLGKLRSDYAEVQASNLSEVAQADLIILAVHPPDLKTVLGEMKGAVSASSIVLSLVPKVTIAAIQSALEIRQVVRMIPNAPSAIGRGYNPVVFAEDVDSITERGLKSLFTPWGESPVVPEGDLETYAIVSAMGPTYMWFQWQILRDLAVSFSLSREAADKALLATIAGSAELLLAHGRDPERVMDMIPVKPMQADEEAFRSAYTNRLTALYEKLKVH